MAKFEKGSPEAKAWGRKMALLRDGGSMKKPRGNSVVKKTGTKRRIGKMKVHLLPDIFYVGAGYELVGPAIINMVEDVKGGGMAALGDQGNIMGSLDMVKAGAIPAAELAVVGIVLKWAGKKLGLNRVGTKEVKLL